jgi:hypothetical protein
MAEMMRFSAGTPETGPKAGPAEWLCLLATPAFAAMALLTAGGGEMLCTMPGLSALSGMSFMYLLMSVFHAAPWLKRMRASPPPEPEGTNGERKAHRA